MSTTSLPPAPPSSLSKSLAMSRSVHMQRLLRDTVSIKERSTINQWLWDAEKDLKSQQAEIARLKMQILTLENRCEGLKRTMEIYRSLLSPIYRIPPEILLNIFTFACEENEMDGTSTAPAASALSMVCGRWHELALSVPGLWSSFSIMFGFHENIPSLERTVNIFLERSKTASLRLVLDFSYLRYSFDRLHNTMKALVQSSPRWTSVSFMVTASILDDPVFEPIKGNLPILSHLDLSPTSSGDYTDFRIAELQLFADCPSLRSFTFSPDVVLASNGFMHFPWEAIASLEITLCVTSSAVQLLSRFANLETLSFTRVGGGDDNQLAQRALSNAKHLSILAESHDDIASAFLHTTLPRLLSLDICGYNQRTAPHDWKIWIPSPLEGFLARSECKITSLRLSWLPICDSDVISLLRTMPSLSSLKIDEYKGLMTVNRIVTPNLLGRLVVDHGYSSATSSHFLPRLVDLRLSIHCSNLDVDTLLRAVSSRWLPDPSDALEIGISCLHYLGLNIMGSKDELKTLQDLGGLGLWIDVSYTKTLRY